MHRIARGLLAGASLLALAGAASAADMAVKARPLPPPPPVWTWTGFYFGAHVGAGWSTTESELTSVTVGPPINATLALNLPLSSHNNNGFLGGGQIGYNWQAGWAVFGVEADIAATGIKGKAPCLVVFSCTTKHDWLATAAARFGVSWDRTLVYVKGGAAWAESEYSASLSILGIGITKETRLGALFGAGVEQGIAGGWSAKLEYNYIDFGTRNYAVPVLVGALPVAITANTDITEKMHLVKFGLNYRFDFGKAPVVARY
jgi:outer membrane immunogenic protein